MRFAHSISTDGYSVTLVTTNKSVRGRNHSYQSGVSTRKRKTSDATEKVPDAFREEFPHLKADTVADVIEYLRSIGCGEFKEFVGGDPGKTILLALVDEFRNKLCYSAAQRRHDTDGGRNNIKISDARGGGRRFKTAGQMRHKASIRRLPGPIQVPGRAGNASVTLSYVTTCGLESEMRKRHLSAKTVDLEKYRQYVAFREAARGSFETTYWRRMFRAMRFTAWTKREKSVENFANRILEKYGNRCGSVNKQVVILYGNWGRRPRHFYHLNGNGNEKRTEKVSTSGKKFEWDHAIYSNQNI